MSEQQIKQPGFEVKYNKARIETAEAESDLLLSATFLPDGLTDKEAKEAHDWAVSRADNVELARDSKYFYWLRYYFDNDYAEERGN